MFHAFLYFPTYPAVPIRVSLLPYFFALMIYDPTIFALMICANSRPLLLPPILIPLTAMLFLRLLLSCPSHSIWLYGNAIGFPTRGGSCDRGAYRFLVWSNPGVCRHPCSTVDHWFGSCCLFQFLFLLSCPRCWLYLVLSEFPLYLLLLLVL